MLCCGAVARCASYDANLATAPQHIPTQHDMLLPQHLVCKCELNCEYRNITLARNKAPWWRSDKIETCRSVLKVFYVKLYVHSLVDKSKWFYENARCYNKIYKHTILCSPCLVSIVASHILIYTKCQHKRSLDTEMLEVRPQAVDVHMWILTREH